MLRSGIICFLTLQTICTNGERRLAVRAANDRPYRKRLNKLKRVPLGRHSFR
nr:MAG TPA: hypothetical protein [Caudoviricetes sp.]